MQCLALLLLAIVLEGGAAAYLFTNTQAFTFEFRAQVAATMRKVSSGDSGTSSPASSADDVPPGGGASGTAHWTTSAASARGFSALALDTVHAGWFGGVRCCGENGSSDWLKLPLPSAAPGARTRWRSSCHSRVPASCCVNPGMADAEYQWVDGDDENDVMDSNAVHTNGCANAAHVWFGRITSSFAIITAIVAVFQVRSSVL